MSLDTDIRLLSRVKLFEGFDREALRLLAFGAEARTYGAGTRLFRAGEQSDGAYVVVTGAIDLYPEEGSQPPMRLEQGALIGEMAVIVPTLRANTAMAVEHSEVLKVPRPLFRRMLEEYPELAAILQQRIAGSVDEFMARLERIRAKLDHANEIAARPE
ncbi:cyclic nucleotide-binding domain-containing protein [Ahrensia sp. R2A130]|uniref:cyclic nucleotide-binding domain-containing protein n=1 Tax=Ahrensia sp. R2A130 TaxID=744979 RepID=UPI0001E08C98|nr:cyclic nucleotide-binding domain-containing protein [Ahrensia sp. R2A130]EFL88114.1 cAMP-dependent protein kinase regulatory subunit [Ahrensia sp. R2A130]